MYKIFDEVIKFISEATKNLKVGLKVGGRTLSEVKIQRGIFQGDALSPFLFVIAMMPLNYILRKFNGGYKFTELQEKFNYLIYMDDIKLFAKKEKELESLVQTIRISSQSIGIKFVIEKCTMFIMKSGKRQITEGIEVPRKRQNVWDRKNYKYLGIFKQTSSNKQKWKKKIRKEYYWPTRKLLGTKVYRRKLIKRINTWTVHLIRYPGPFLKWTKNRPEDKKVDEAQGFTSERWT